MVLAVANRVEGTQSTQFVFWGEGRGLKKEARFIRNLWLLRGGSELLRYVLENLCIIRATY